MRLENRCFGCEGPTERRCLACYGAKVERETLARVVAWLRRHADQPHSIESGEMMFSPMTRGVLHMAASDIERGAWKEDGDADV